MKKNLQPLNHQAKKRKTYLLWYSRDNKCAAVTRTFISCLEFHTKPGLKYIIFEGNTFTVLHHSLLYCFRSEIVLLQPEFLSLLPWLPLLLAAGTSFSQVNLEIFCRIKQQHFYSQILNLNTVALQITNETLFEAGKSNYVENNKN